MTVELAIETYDETIKFSQPHEYPFWVQEVNRCVINNCMPTPEFCEWVSKVTVIVLYRNKINVSKSDF